MMRKEKFAAGEIYHLYNRGVRREPIFLEDSDRNRFIFLLLYCQLPLPLSNNEYHANLFDQHGSFYQHTHREQIEVALSLRRVELIAFCLMPNHFHAVVRACEDVGVSKYLQRLQNAYTKYFNIKHKKTGHLFEGPFKAVRVKGNDQLLHLSAYVHRNPRSLQEWRGKEAEYPYSSFPDYLGENRWKELLKPDLVLGQFNGPTDYKKFIDSSSAKSIETKLDVDHLIEE